MDENTRRDMELLYRYKYMIENIRDIVWETDINLVFTFVSPTVKEMTGFEVEELAGRCILDFLRFGKEQWSNLKILFFLMRNSFARMKGPYG